MIGKYAINNHYKLLFSLLCCLTVFALAAPQPNALSPQHALVDRILLQLEQQPKIERVDEYQRWLDKLIQQHRALATSLSQQNATQKYHLSMGEMTLEQLKSDMQASLKSEKPAPVHIDFSIYTRHFAYLANAKTPQGVAYGSLIQKIVIVFIAIFLIFTFRKTIPALQQDISRLKQRYQRHKKLQKSINQYVGYATIHMSPDGVVHFMDEASTQLFNLPSLAGKPLLIDRLLRHSEDTDILSSLQGQLTQSDANKFIGIGKNNHNFPCKIATHPFVDDDGSDCILLIIQDTSEFKRLEEKSLQSQKMEALGHLTGGIGHDFNNLLLIIQGNLRLLEEDLTAENDNEKLELLSDALSATTDGAQLTARLLSFSRKQALKAESCDINILCKNFLRMIERALGGETNVELKLNGDNNTVIVDTAQLQNALLNLALNARDAMPNGGTVQLEISNIAIDERNALQYSPEPPMGTYILISVSDTGTGISKSLQSKIFDPFFTTKQAGQGTGMGLSMVYSFAQQSHGSVCINSTLGIGTTISLLLPHAKQISKPSQQTSSTHNLPRGQEHVLIVEDEDRVRKFTSNCLNSLGYTTTSVDNADAAHELLSQTQHGFHALFCDMIMPGNLSGPQLAQWVKSNRPELSTLMTTGYCDASHDNKDGAEFDVIYKPYSKKELAVSLRNALDNS